MLSDDGDGTQTLSWIFTQGVDPRCTSAGPAANSCSVQIFDGTSPDAPGNPYWNQGDIPQNPWPQVRYIVQGSLPTAVNDVEVTTGLTSADLDGRVVVVYDYDGVPVGIAIIELPEDVPEPAEGDDLYVFDFSPYPGSSSPYQPTGVVEVKSTDNGVTQLSWSLTDVDPSCSSDCTGTNCCGITINEGRSQLTVCLSKLGPGSTT